VLLLEEEEVKSDLTKEREDNYFLTVNEQFSEILRVSYYLCTGTIFQPGLVKMGTSFD
jgi:hypothetical protein